MNRNEFEAPKNDAHVEDEVLDLAPYEITKEREESYQRISDVICDRFYFSDILETIKRYGIDGLLAEITEKAIEHIKTRAVVMMHMKNMHNTANGLQTLFEYGYPVSKIQEIIVEGLTYDVEKNGIHTTAFREGFATEDILDLFGFLSFNNIPKELFITEETKKAAQLRLPLDYPEKVKRRLIANFHLEGEEVNREVYSQLKNLITAGNFNPVRLQEFLSDEYTIEYDEAGNPIINDSLDEAWKKIQERFGIKEDYRDLIHQALDKILESEIETMGKQVFIEGVVQRNSQYLKEYLEGNPELIQKIYKLAATVLFADTALLVQKGWLFQAMAEQNLIPIESFRDLYKQVDGRRKLFLQRHCKEVLDIDAAFTIKLLGDNASTDSYHLIKKIREGRVGQFDAIAGITQSGEEGIKQVESIINDLKQNILNENFDPSVIRNNRIVADFAKGYLRINEREWGTRSLEDSIWLYMNQKDAITPLAAEVYQPSEPMRVNTVRAKADKDFVFSEQFQSSFGELNSDIRWARTIAMGMEERKSPKPFSGFIKHLEEVIQEVRESALKSLKSASQEKKKFIQERIERLGTLNFRNLEALENNLQVLSQIPEAHRIVRRIIFTFVYAKHGINDLYSPGNETTSNTDDISNVINFINHIGYEETWKQYFSDKRSRNNFQKIASTRALEEELKRIQNQAIAGTTVMQFIPTRGFLMEVSGSLADACWADRNNNLLASEHPNFTSVTFVQNPESKDERIAGACLLIESESSAGEPLLIIRGLNPLENVINRLSVADFYEKFTTYCKEIAERGGRKLGIAIDGHSGGSSTNRPVLFNYLRSLALKKVPLKYDDETNFNGYDITGDTFLVE